MTVLIDGDNQRHTRVHGLCWTTGRLASAWPDDGAARLAASKKKRKMNTAAGLARGMIGEGGGGFAKSRTRETMWVEHT